MNIEDGKVRNYFEHKKNINIEREEMPGATKAVRAYNKSLFEQGLIKCFVCKEIKPLDDFGNNDRTHMAWENDSL